VVTIACLIVLVASAVVVFVDASARDWRDNRWAKGPLVWSVGVLGFWIGVVPLYLDQRSKAPLKQGPRGSPPRAAPKPAAQAGPDTSGSVPPPG